jgi:methionyl aminopeptidase
VKGQISSQQNSEVIRLHDQMFLENQRVAGKVVAKTLALLEGLVKEKTTKTLLGLDQIAHDYIVSQNCVPTFLGYKSFPNSVCISVNKQLVHGIPTDYVLQEGDLVSFDLGATYHGAIADAAITCIYGQPREKRHQQLVDDCKEALNRAITSVAVGKRIGAIGHTIYRYGRDKGYGVITNFGGHGISIDQEGNGIPHASPFIANRAEPTEGIRITAGMALAIEPQFTLGSTDTITASDGWTVECSSLSAHEEHTIFVHDDCVEVITARV